MTNETGSLIVYLFLVELCYFPVQCLEDCWHDLFFFFFFFFTKIEEGGGDRQRDRHTDRDRQRQRSIDTFLHND